MDQRELQRRLREATVAWHARYSNRIDTAYPQGSNPHDGHTTDFAEHAAVMSAPQEIAELLEEEHLRILAEYNAPDNAEQRRRDAGGTR